MGNNQSTVMRVHAQLAQAQRQIQSLQTQNKAARSKAITDQKETLAKAKEQAQPDRMVVNSVRFSQDGSTIEQPSPVKLTLSAEKGILSKPLQLVEESHNRNLTLTEKRTTRTLPDGTNIYYRFYYGLTDPNNAAKRIGYGVQRHTFKKNLIFVIRVDTTVPQSMTEDDVKWVWNHLRQQKEGSGAAGMDLRNRMAQQMGRPGMPMPFIEGSVPLSASDPYSINVQLPNRDQPAETIQFRPPSAFPSDQIHFQQIDNR